MKAGLLGAITSPRAGYRVAGLPAWCGDNDRFGTGWAGYARWARWLHRQPRAGCWFVLAPDVPYDAAATLRYAPPALALIARLGFPPALAAQDGIDPAAVPWGDIAVLFLGGTDAFKLGPGARQLTAQARERGLGVHMGRVNSLRRWRYARDMGCTSCDGTFTANGPDIRVPEAVSWGRDAQLALFGIGEAS
jgi:hypothetical protein